MKITQEWLETCGTASLEGALLAEGIIQPQPVTLSFEQCRPEPQTLLMPDYAPACLVESVLNLIGKGFSFKVETYRKETR